VVFDDYLVKAEDFYVGVDADGPTTITLPEVSFVCPEKIIKSEMGAPIGNRKITIVAAGNVLIDNQQSIDLQQPYEFIRVIFRSGKWFQV
jgi:hypothetical protein